MKIYIDSTQLSNNGPLRLFFKPYFEVIKRTSDWWYSHKETNRLFSFKFEHGKSQNFPFLPCHGPATQLFSRSAGKEGAPGWLRHRVANQRIMWSRALLYLNRFCLLSCSAKTYIPKRKFHSHHIKVYFQHIKNIITYKLLQKSKSP